MHCPYCGSPIENAQAFTCPTCGQVLPRQAAPSGGMFTSPNEAPNQPTSYGPPTRPETPGPQPPAYLPPAPPPGYPQQPVAPGYEPSAAPYGAPAPTANPSAPPSGYPYPYPNPYASPAYGQPAPPISAPYGPYGPYPPPLNPVPPARQHSGKRIALLVISIVAAVVVVCGGASALLYYVGTQSRAQTPNGGRQGTVIFQDSMTDPTTRWSNDPGKCFYGSDGYHVATGYICYAPTGSQADFDMSVRVTQINGDTTEPYGLIFRATPHESNYGFFITGDSQWSVYRCNLASSVCDRIIGSTVNTAISAGLNTSNALEVRGIGSHFQFFVNGTQIGEMDNASLASGLVGVAGGQSGGSGECVFTNFVVSRPG